MKWGWDGGSGYRSEVSFRGVSPGRNWHTLTAAQSQRTDVKEGSRREDGSSSLTEKVGMLPVLILSEAQSGQALFPGTQRQVRELRVGA